MVYGEHLRLRSPARLLQKMAVQEAEERSIKSAVDLLRRQALEVLRHRVHNGPVLQDVVHEPHMLVVLLLDLERSGAPCFCCMFRISSSLTPSSQQQ